MVTCEFVTLQALLAVVLDAGWCSAAAFAVEDLGDARAELPERDRRSPFFQSNRRFRRMNPIFFPVAIP